MLPLCLFQVGSFLVGPLVMLVIVLSESTQAASTSHLEDVSVSAVSRGWAPGFLQQWHSGYFVSKSQIDQTRGRVYILARTGSGRR